jgi:hypothetical protein
MRTRAVVLAATVAAVALLAATSWVWSQAEAPKVDPERQKELDARKQAQLERELRQARSGKYMMVEVGKLTVGSREMVTVTLEDFETIRHTALVPRFLNKDKRWETPDDLVQALRNIPRGNFEVIHLDERFGLAWVVGVGKDSPDTIESLEKQIRNRKWTPETPAAGQGDEPVKAAIGKSTGKFVELATVNLDGLDLRTVVIERGLTGTRGQFYMASVDRKGKFTKAPAALLKQAETLRKDDQVEIEYTQHGDYLVVVSLRVVKD